MLRTNVQRHNTLTTMRCSLYKKKCKRAPPHVFTNIRYDVYMGYSRLLLNHGFSTKTVSRNPWLKKDGLKESFKISCQRSVDIFKDAIIILSKRSYQSLSILSKWSYQKIFNFFKGFIKWVMGTRQLSSARPSHLESNTLKNMSICDEVNF